jgi:PTH1 family peptidyl-tRNA hydrolase
MPEQKKSKYKIVAGLGNPGKEFENTYHNVGVVALSGIAQKWSDESILPKFKSRKGLFEYAKTKNYVLVKPLVFMNESGKAIASAAREFGAKPENIIIIHDDSDITLGNFKVSFGKNAGGHKGVQSIIDAVRSKNFTRIRIGIRPKTETRRKKAEAFVLAIITKKDKEILDGVFEKIKSEI